MPLSRHRPYPVQQPPKLVPVPFKIIEQVPGPEVKVPVPVPSPPIAVPYPVNHYITVPGKDRIIPVPVPVPVRVPGGKCYVTFSFQKSLSSIYTLL